MDSSTDTIKDTNERVKSTQIKYQPLSRREEDEIQKRIKLNALKRCDSIVSEFASCSSNRTFSVVWACRDQWKSLKECMKVEMSEDKVDKEKLEFLKKREELRIPYQKI